MKKLIRAAAFCFCLLAVFSVFLLHTSAAKEDLVTRLLQMPAPPPPNPLVSTPSTRDVAFYSTSKTPLDNASTEDLLDYWSGQSERYTRLRYTPEISDRNLVRIKKEIEKDPKRLPQLLNVFVNDKEGGDFVKGIYDREGTTGAFDKDVREQIKAWLTLNSRFFSEDLARSAAQVNDADEYVTNQEELLALARHDFDRAKPLIDRLLANNDAKVSQALAKWALYRHAVDTDSLGDIERYRDELKAIVENKDNPDGMRDLAMDALVSEKEFSGRDDWYYSLMTDESLVKMQRFTGLTTLIQVSPDEKYIEKMIEFLRSDNPLIRGAAIRNLTLRLDTNNPDIIRALLPWLEDPNWAVDNGNTRETIVSKLGEIFMPEAVPGLIKMLEEKTKRVTRTYSANTMANVASLPANSMANAARSMANAANSMRPANAISTAAYSDDEATLFRMSAVRALTKQKDGRANSSLRRILASGDLYERMQIMSALLACGGFSVPEQMDALEYAAKGVRDDMDTEDAVAAGATSDPRLSNANFANGANVSNNAPISPNRPLTAAEFRTMLATQITSSTEISDELAKALVDRIEGLDKTNQRLSQAFRRMALKWQNSVINSLLLRDIKNDNAGIDSVVKILSQRKDLREKQPADVVDLQNGTPTAQGFAACLLEAEDAYTAVLEGGNGQSKASMLACARMIRARLPVAKVGESLRLDDKRLATAAERYLESEDSPEARSMVLALHPGEAKILGATTAFFVDGAGDVYNDYLYALYQSIGDNSMYNGWGGSENESIRGNEKKIQAELKKDPDLLGVYGYDVNYIRIYADRVIFSWDEDESRYRERELTKYEFDEIKTYLTTNRVEDLPPFLGCGGDYCVSKELFMVGKNGGRRVFVNGEGYEFFDGLNKYFERLKETPATIKYAMSRDFPGLELVLADDTKHVETVWAGNGEILVAVSDKAVRKKIEEELDKVLTDDTEETIKPEVDKYVLREKLKDKRKSEGLSWHKVTNGTLGETVPQPLNVEIIPPVDGLAVPAVVDQWKARAPGIEIRCSSDGLFKVVRGSMTKVRAGSYSYPIITPNGRWVLANKVEEEFGYKLVRIDLLSNKEYPVEIDGYGRPRPHAYIATLNKILVVNEFEYENYESYQDENDDTAPPESDPDAMFLIDPATSVMQPASGEFRPLAQTTFRPLQSNGKANEYWSAMIDSEKNITRLGIYDTKLFSFKTVMTLPKIAFNSMGMFVDEPGKKVYFVYRGHLLSLPLTR